MTSSFYGSELRIPHEKLRQQGGRALRGHAIQSSESCQTTSMTNLANSQTQTYLHFISLTKKQFLSEDKTRDSAFTVEENKTQISYLDRDTVFLGTKFENEEFNGLTDSGYPRMVKIWARGKEKTELITIFDGNKQDVASGGHAYSWTRVDEKTQKKIICSAKLSYSYKCITNFLSMRYKTCNADLPRENDSQCMIASTTSTILLHRISYDHLRFHRAVEIS